MSKSKTILKDSIFLSGSTYVSYLFTIVKSLAIRRLLSPTLMGLLSELMLVRDYTKSHHLGVLNALDREIPYYRGKKDTKKVEEVKKTGLNFSMCTALCASLILFIVATILGLRHFDRDFTIGLHLVAVLIATEIVIEYFRIILRTHNKFRLLSKFNIIYSGLEALFTILLIYIYGYKGAFLSLIFVTAVSFIYLIRRSGFKFSFGLRFKIKKTIDLLKIGFPLHLYKLVRTLFLTVDKLMIIFLLGRTPLGIYSIATMAYNFLTPLPRSVYNVLFPKFYEAYGKSGKVESVKHYLIKPTMIFAYLFPILLGLGSIYLPLVVEYVLPRYREGIVPALIIIIGTFFYSLIFMWQFFLIALYKQLKMVQFNMIAVIMSVCLNLLFVKVFNLGLVGIALGTMLSHFLLSTLIIGYVFSYYSKEFKEHLLLFIQIYTPIVWIGALLVIFRYFFNYANISFWDDFFRSLIFDSILFVCSIPLIYYVNKETGVVALFWKMLKGKIKK